MSKDSVLSAGSRKERSRKDSPRGELEEEEEEVPGFDEDAMPSTSWTNQGLGLEMQQ